MLLWHYSIDKVLFHLPVLKVPNFAAIDIALSNAHPEKKRRTLSPVLKQSRFRTVFHQLLPLNPSTLQLHQVNIDLGFMGTAQVCEADVAEVRGFHNTSIFFSHLNNLTHCFESFSF